MQKNNVKGGEREVGSSVVLVYIQTPELLVKCAVCSELSEMP